MNSLCVACGASFHCGAFITSEPCWCAKKAPTAIDSNQPHCFCEPCLDKRREKQGELVHLRFLLSYRGTHFSGFQVQANARTVEGEFTKALASIVQQEVSIQAAGRTDAGVHARGQVISASFYTRLSLRQLSLAMAARLPSDLAVWRIDKMPGAFDARRQSIGKQYIYRIAQSLIVDPFMADQVWHIRQPLNIEAMSMAAQQFVGEHDFQSFRSSLCGAAHAVRFLWHVGINKVGDIIEIDVRGNAFCLNMVRIIVGTLVEVGLGKVAPQEIAEILLAKDRTRAGRTAKAQGLCFNKVYYPDDLDDALLPQDVRFPRYPVTKESWPFDENAIERGPS